MDARMRAAHTWQGVVTARQTPGQNTIVMRNGQYTCRQVTADMHAGTHFINQTIEFVAEDSYLTIQACRQWAAWNACHLRQNYPGETPILNAGQLVQADWTFLGNNTPPAPGSFYVYQNENAVDDTVPTPGKIDVG